MSTLGAVLLLLLVATAQASAEVNISGTWKSVYHCEVGCSGQEFPAEPTFVQEKGSSQVHETGGTTTGTITGYQFTLENHDVGYHFESTVTISADCQTWSGHLKDSNGTEGTDTATRVTGSCEVPGGGTSKALEEAKEREAKEHAVHASAVTVSCNYDPLTSVDTCTAQVADASGSGVAPTGTVGFTSTSPGGFLFGAACTLSASPSAPSVPACSVAYLAQDGSLPGITATYAGDAHHAASSGHTQLLGASPSGETSAEGGTAHPGQYPNELDVSTSVPANGTNVSVCVQPQGAAAFARAAGLLGNISAAIGAAVADVTKAYPAEKGVLQGISGAFGGEETLLRELGAGHVGKQIGELLGAPQAKAANVEEAKLQTGLDVLFKDVNQLAPDVKTQDDLHLLASDQSQLLDAIHTDEQATCTGGTAVAAAHSSAVGAGATEARKGHRAKRPVNLAYATSGKVAAGPLKLHLHLNARLLKRLTARKKSLALTVRVNMVLPSSAAPHGYPVAVVERVTIRRASKHK